MQDIGLAEYQQQGVIEAATDGYLDHQAQEFRGKKVCKFRTFRRNETVHF
jgi:hypothetical protein